MDKLDESIKEAVNPIEPTADFTNTTMTKIQNMEQQKPPSRFGFKKLVPALGGLVAVLVIAAVILLGSTKLDKASSKNSSSVATTNTKPAAVSSNSSVVPAGTDYASLSTALNDVNSSMNQENSDQAFATSSLNDSSQEITIPTYQ